VELGKKVYLNETHRRDVVIAAYRPRIMRVEFYACQVSRIRMHDSRKQ
jgi:hypothetical protein